MDQAQAADTACRVICDASEDFRLSCTFYIYSLPAASLPEPIFYIPVCHGSSYSQPNRERTFFTNRLTRNPHCVPGCVNIVQD